MRKLSSLVLVGIVVGGFSAASTLRARGQDKPADKPAEVPKPVNKPADPPAPVDSSKPAQKEPLDLAQIVKLYADYEPAEREFWDYLNGITIMQKHAAVIIDQLKVANDAAKKDPKDEALRKVADALQAEFKALSDTHQAMAPEYMKRNQAHMEKLRAIYIPAAALTKAHPDDWKAQAFLLKFMCEQGGISEVQDDVARLYAEHADDRDVRLMFGETCLCVPVPRRDPRDRRPHAEPRPPRFEKAYEALAPLAKAEPKDQAVQLVFGVAACAIGKNAEAKAALATVAAIGSIRPATRIIIGNFNDPEAVFKIWKDAADGLSEKPNDVDLLKKRAELLVGCQAVHLAIGDAEAAIKAKPDDKDAAMLLARCYMYSNSFDLAAKIFADVVKANEKDTDARVEYALALYSTNRMAESRDLLAKVAPEERGKLPPKLQEALMNAHPEKLVDDWAAEEKARAEDAKRDDNPRVLLETVKGAITIELFEDTAPNTVANFVYLAGNGFYDGVHFHRVEQGFMAQGGDPAGNGMGGPQYTIKDEFDLKKNTRLHWRGTLSMAKTGMPNSGGSQFFMCFQPTPHLNGRHAVFGRVIEGQDVVDRIERDDAIVKATVLRKRQHEYVPEKIAIPGQKAWEPGQPRLGDKKKPPEGEKKPDVEKKPPEGEKK